MSIENLDSFGVHATSEALTRSLHQYIEAQYHIRAESLIAERDALLKQEGVIAQLPYIEATPVYELARPYSELKIPKTVSDVLESIATNDRNAGIHARPYFHQAEALEAFHGDEPHDLVVATGTGSGKTESFLMPIIGELARESNERSSSRDLPGCRALLIYPMNALVNDQVARIRRLLGSEIVNQLVSKGRRRPVQFGSYTGRTPYPNVRTAAKDKAQIAPLFDDFYIPAEKNEELKQQLVGMGRWPSKDMKAFYNAEAAQTKKNDDGKERIQHNWKYRLLTQDGDRELMTRHEMHLRCPDILVTNYSMLEYMLLRPIEAKIFDDTAKWLQADSRNQLILVLDEAHMYRGAGGAEVAMLIRRLIARLNVTRDRVRCILTSASLGDGEQAIQGVKEFAMDLTGRPPSNRSFKVITGRRETRSAGRIATAHETETLASIDLTVVAQHLTQPANYVAEIERLAKELSWPSPPADSKYIGNYLYSALTGFGPAELLISHVMGEATKLNDLRDRIFGRPSGVREARALDALLLLCTLAKEASSGRVLMPTRVHLFYRGIPGLHVCVDGNCDARLSRSADKVLLGRFYTKSTMSCSCSSSGRVFEFRTHRDCGAAFLHGWVDRNCDFVWAEPDLLAPDSQQRELYPIEMLVEEPTGSSIPVREKWLHIPSGRLSDTNSSDDKNYRLVYVPVKNLNVTKELTFERCPICSKRTVQDKKDVSKIMDHVTKGEAPFSSLVRTQLFHQHATRKAEERFPNGGRKVLIFSDGRQKAARLARDLPRDMELDVFRQTIAASANALRLVGIKEARPTDGVLYVAFLSVLNKHNLSMFDLESGTLEEHAASLKIQNGSDLYEAVQDGAPGPSPKRYKIALLKLLCSSYYSLSGTTVGFVEPTEKVLGRINTALSSKLKEEDVYALAVAWIDEMLSGYAFDADIEPNVRAKAAGFGFGRPDWASKGLLPAQLRSRLIQDLNMTTALLDEVENVFRTNMARGNYFIHPLWVKLNIDLSRSWYQCASCTALKPVTFKGRCLECGDTNVKALDPAIDQYIKARKSFWRTPVEAALRSDAEIFNLYAEEHTAQLSNRDRKVVHSTTEHHELRFQDVLLNEKDRPIDVLSCTTTMEVGIDIGSLVAVALRNMPPQRENYQQRAGRAGRRGSAVSSVITYSQNGPHDAHYFLNPKTIVRGSPRNPELKVDNPKIVRRHVHSFLIQTFFLECRLETSPGAPATLLKALGGTRSFFWGENGQPDLTSFQKWLETNVNSQPYRIRNIVTQWLPSDLLIETSHEEWVEKVAVDLLAKLATLKKRVPKEMTADTDESEDDGEEKEAAANFDKEDLLEFLFFHSLLPSYAFPTSLCSFLVEKWHPKKKGWEIRLEQMPQQSTNQALSEYAPGRLVVINKKTYRSGGVFANTAPTEENRAVSLFEKPKVLVMCDICSYVRDPHAATGAPAVCPVCQNELHRRAVIRPEVFGPESARALPEDDREQDFTYATMAQLPQPVGDEKLQFLSVGEHLKKSYSNEIRLLTLNKGASVQGDFQGFSVCTKCGSAKVNSDTSPHPSGRHSRPYLTKTREDCDGEFRDVFLWFDFPTDLLVARIAVHEPIISDLTSLSTVRTLEGAAYSIAEALRLSASRHKQLDLDATEFGAGHRILPIDENGIVYLDIYLYDTLSGGAGYSELAAKYFDDIVQGAMQILRGCNCESSCTDCLDHFYNQHIKGRLDRRLGASLLEYALSGKIPVLDEVGQQRRALKPLLGLLELDSIACDFVQNGDILCINATRGHRSALVQPYSALLDTSQIAAGVAPGQNVIFVNELELRGNLPAVHRRVREALD